MGCWLMKAGLPRVMLISSFQADGQGINTLIREDANLS